MMIGTIVAAGRSDAHNGHRCFDGLELCIGYMVGDTRGPHYWSTQCEDVAILQESLLYYSDTIHICSMCGVLISYKYLFILKPDFSMW